MKLKSLLKYFIFLIIFLLLALEVLLRIFGIGDTRMESIGQSYDTYYGKKFKSWYWTSSPNITFMDKNADFSYIVKTNSLGHREREPLQVLADSVKIKVITLGDSFTEGAGTEQDSTYARQLERIINQWTPACSTAFYNAGTSGSDPFFTYMLLRDKLLPYHPDIVTQTINGSDYVDFILRGGFERFKPDSTSAFRDAPWFEPFYHYCYVLRVLLYLNGYPGDVLMKKDDFIRECETVVNPQFIAIADSFNALAVKNGFKMVFIMHTGYGDFWNNEMVLLQEHLSHALIKKGYCVANIWESMDLILKKDSVYAYGYKHDLHFTGKGYKLMAETIFEETEKHCPGLWDAQ